MCRHEVLGDGKRLAMHMNLCDLALTHKRLKRNAKTLHRRIFDLLKLRFQVPRVSEKMLFDSDAESSSLPDRVSLSLLHWSESSSSSSTKKPSVFASESSPSAAEYDMF